MNKDILEQLSFGFEIEGGFREGLWEKLGFQGNFVHDGSVGRLSVPFTPELIPQTRPETCSECSFNEEGTLVEYCQAHHARYNSEGSPAQEYSSRVFNNLGDCLKEMKLFNKKNHAWNSQCGLHFHIGAKGENKYKQLFGVTSNFQYLKQLLGEAKNYCEHQNERLNSNWMSRYYAFFTNRRELSDSTRPGNDIKYRFVRFHPEYNTLEFRFLVPCEHKINNVQKLLESLTAYLGRTEKVRAYALAETEVRITESVPIEDDMSGVYKEKIEIVKKLHSNDPYLNSSHFNKAKRFERLIRDYGEETATKRVYDEQMGQYNPLPDGSIEVSWGDFAPNFVPSPLLRRGTTAQIPAWDIFTHENRHREGIHLNAARQLVTAQGHMETLESLQEALARVDRAVGYIPEMVTLPGTPMPDDTGLSFMSRISEAVNEPYDFRPSSINGIQENVLHSHN